MFRLWKNPSDHPAAHDDTDARVSLADPAPPPPTPRVPEPGQLRQQPAAQLLLLREPEPRPRPQPRTQPKPAAHHPARIAAFDGIRALATSAVLFYHADFSWAGGGFFGLDVFFVLSGYLITGLLLTEYLREGRISLRRFYHRRAKRLLPALFAVLAAVCLYVVVFLPREAATLRGDVTAALLYVTNWWYIARGQSYFGGTGRPSPLLHLWSLAVEEQFYLLWPPLLIIMLRSSAVRRRQSLPSALWPVAGWIAALAAGSALLMARFYSPWADPSRVYYGTDTRAFELLIGAGLAVGSAARRTHTRNRDRDRDHDRRRAYDRTRARVGNALIPVPNPIPAWRRTIVNDLAAAATLALFGLGVVLVPATTPWVYPLGMLGACFAAAILIRAVEGGGAVARALSWRPLVWFGERSYAVYLWHWPIFDVTRPGVDVTWPAPAIWAVRFVTPFVLAELTFRFLERPVRSGGVGRLAARCRVAARERRLALPAIAAAATVALGACAVGLAGGLTHAAHRFPANAQAIAIDDGPALTIGGRGPGAAAAAVAKGAAAVGATPTAPGPPAVPGASATVPAGQVLPPIPTAMPAPAAVPPKVAFYGDSQGMTMLLNRPANAAAYLDLIDGTTEGCGFLGGRITSRSGERRDLGAGCAGSPQTWAARAARERPDIGILMIGGWDEFDIQLDTATLAFGSPAWDQYYDARLAYSVGLLRAAGIPRLELALLPCYRPVPEPGSGYWPERGDDWRTRHINTLLTTYAQAHPAGMGLLQPPPGFCTDESLATNRDDRWDGLHYYKPGSLLYLMTAIPQLYAPPVV